jgi:hypothetical protein
MDQRPHIGTMQSVAADGRRLHLRRMKLEPPHVGCYVIHEEPVLDLAREGLLVSPQFPIIIDGCRFYV